MHPKTLIPSSVINLINRFRGRKGYGWHGNYPSWDAAERASSGYHAAAILEKVKEALLKVKNNEVAYERDSVTFDKFEYSWPVLAALLWIAAQRKGKLNVLDFGGSLGSIFFQYRKFFNDIDITWNIVEQPNFVACGRQHFANERLRFYGTIAECFGNNQVDVVLLSSVLPYVKEPYGILRELMQYDPPYFIFDKMPFLTEGTQDLLTVQTVHPSIYNTEASYPAWFFNESRFLEFLKPTYSVIEEFEGTDTANIPACFKGMIVQRKKDRL